MTHRFDDQLAPGNPVQGGRHPDDGFGKGFVGQGRSSWSMLSGILSIR